MPHVMLACCPYLATICNQPCGVLQGTPVVSIRQEPRRLAKSSQAALKLRQAWIPCPL